jgi:OOP family OmpA-OmpF porin
MADSIFASLLSTLNSRSVSEVAQTVGQPEQAVSRGLESSIATLLGGLANKASDSGVLRKLLDLVPSSAGPVSWSQMASSVTDPGSTLLAAGQRMLPALFGSNEHTVTSEISRASSLPFGSASTLLSMAAPMVMSFLSRHMRDTGMNINGLGAVLQGESANLRSAIPGGLSSLFWPGTRTTVETGAPVVSQAVKRETSSNWLIPALAIAALALGLMWLFSHARRPGERAAVSVPLQAPVGEANRYAIPTPRVTGCRLPASVVLRPGGVEARMMAFIQDSDAKLDTATWFNNDQINFRAGSAALRPDSQAELNTIAAILKSCPNVHLAVAAYTDNTGSAQANLRLSRSRAALVVAELVDKGVPRDRLTSEGYGDQNPVADNSTAEGRAQNRRIAIRVTKR